MKNLAKTVGLSGILALWAFSVSAAITDCASGQIYVDLTAGHIATTTLHARAPSEYDPLYIDIGAHPDNVSIDIGTILASYKDRTVTLTMKADGGSKVGTATIAVMYRAGETPQRSCMINVNLSERHGWDAFAYWLKGLFGLNR